MTSATLLRNLDTISRLANTIGSLLILALIVLICADIFGRNVFLKPISGVPELIALSIVVIVFLQAPQTLRSGRMTRSDAFINKLTSKFPRVGNLLETIYDLISIGLLGAIIYSTFPIFQSAWDNSEFVGVIGDFTAPVWPVKLVVLIGGILLILQFIARIARRYWVTEESE